MLVGALATLGGSLLLRPVYVASARVLVEDSGGAGGLLSAAMSELPGGLGSLVGGAPQTAAEMEMLRSRPVVTSVVLPPGVDEIAPEAGQNLLVRVDDLALQRLWMVALRRLRGQPDPEGGLRVEVAEWGFPEDFDDALLLRFLPEGRLEIAIDRLLDRRSARLAWRPGEPLAYEAARLVLRSDVAPEALAGRAFRVTVRSLQKTVDDFLEELEVKESERGSNVLRIAWPDADAERSAATVNALLQAYQAHNRQRLAGRAGRPARFLEQQIERVRGELREVEEELSRFGREAGLLVLPESAGRIVEKLAELDVERARLELSATATDAFVKRYDDGQVSLRELAGLEAVLTAEAPPAEPLSVLLAQKRGLEALYNEQWPELRELEAIVEERVGALRTMLASRVENERRLSSDLDQIQQRYLTELEGLPETQIELLRYQRKVEAFSQIYLFLLGQLQDAHIREATAVPAVDVIESAVAPLKRSSPKLAVNLVLGAVLGLVGAIVHAFLREARRPLCSVRQAAQAAGLRPLGELPLERGLREAPLVLGPWAPAAGRTGEAARALRALRSSVLHAAEALAAPRRLCVVSSERGEGRSLVAANLAVSLATTGARVLLIDAADVRPTLARWLGLEGERGLSSALAGEDALQPTALEPLSLLAADAGEAADTLAGASGAAALERVAAGFEWVVVDTAPLGESALAPVVARWCDAALLVARAGRTPEAVLVRTAEQLWGVGAEVLGVVLDGT